MKNKIVKTSVLILAAVSVFTLSGCRNTQPVVTPDTPEEQTPMIYSHVAIIGVDGGGNFFDKADTPNMDRIFANGATSYSAQAEIPTSSAENWGAIIHGVACDVHGFTNDSAAESSIDSDYPYPSVFKVIKQSIPNAEMCSVVNWWPIDKGLIEWDIGVHLLYECGDDLEVSEESVNMINDFCPALLFVQFDGLDGIGHVTGYGSPEYYDRLTEIDGYIGQIYDAYDDLGVLDETLFIVVSDHGGTYCIDENGIGSGSHGGTTPEEVTVFLGVAGKTVANTDLGAIRNRDAAAITAAALGIEIPQVWTSRVPDGLFTDR